MSQKVDIAVPNVKEITITEQRYVGESSPQPFRTIEISIRSEGEKEQALSISCFTRDQGFLVTKLRGPDDLVSRSIEVKYAGP